MIAFPTDKGGAAIRPHDDTLDRELSYRMQQISKKTYGLTSCCTECAEYVGLANILDRELCGREPVEGPHR